MDDPQHPQPAATLSRAGILGSGSDGQTAEPPRIRTATLNDVKFLDHLQRKFSASVGFLPRAALQVYCEAGKANVILENGEPAGYLLGSHRLKWQPLLRPIFQAAVAMDAQRRHLGLALLRNIECEAIANNQVAIQACCRVGVEANEFWHAAGFQPIAHLTPDTSRKKDVICWRKLLTPKAPMWFIELPQRAGYRAARTRSHRYTERRTDDLNEALKFISRKQTPGRTVATRTAPDAGPLLANG